MEEYLQKLSAYIAEHPPDIHSDGGDTILDALFWAYCESAGADNENVQQGYDSLSWVCLLDLREFAASRDASRFGSVSAGGGLALVRRGCSSGKIRKPVSRK